MVSMNEMAEILLSFENKRLPIDHIPGPEVVYGCNSDNTLINKELRWAPSMHLKVFVRWCRCSRMDYASHIYRSRSRLRKRSHEV
ncbi:hypothetical protein BDL97_08G044200 [Sphagnum fallax]|nr:hypothetical protein BDL97_08G044200 [Sphagnum fallax]